MADPQDQPDSEPDGASTPPDKQPPEKAVKKTAKAAAKKTPAKKVPAKRAPAKKAPAKKAPAKGAESAAVSQPGQPAEQSLDVAQRIETNGQHTAAKDAAAQAKSTIEGANNPLSPEVVVPAASQSRVPLIIALTLALLAILLVRQLRRR